MHEAPLIATIAAAFTAAWLLGLVTQRAGLSPIVGYLLGGVLIGPYTPGFVGDVHLAQQLAEVGVILLMFGVGLHFHLKDLLAVQGIAIPGAVGQSLTATALSIALFSAFGFPWVTGAVIGMAIAVASTVVLMRVLMDADLVSSPEGHVAVGWLIVEDIFTVIVLVMIPVLGAEYGSGAEAVSAHVPLWETLGIAVLKLAVLVAIVAIVGSRVVPRVLVQVARLRSRELFTLTVLVFSIAIAAGSYIFFGASMALGAFLAGMVVGQSPVSHQAAADALPLRDAFAVLFFVSVGMLFDPVFLLSEPLLVFGALAIILIVKPLAALSIVALLGHSVRTALTVALGLAQIGEFSFILSDLARRNGLMPDAGHNLLVASAIISITINPLLFRTLPRIEQALRNRPRLWHLLNRRAERRISRANQIPAHDLEPTKRLAIVVGFGPVGRSVHRLLRESGLSTVVIDLNMDTVDALRAEDQLAIFGDASHENLLEQAGIRRATHLLVTLPDSSACAAVVAAARGMSATVRILVRARYLGEREGLEQAGATAAVFEEAEAAVALARLVLADTGVYRESADQKIKDLRLQLLIENISDIRSRRVRSVMVPWTRVRHLVAGTDRKAILERIAQERFSRWPVVEPQSGSVVGYLLAKDLIAHAAESDWSQLVRGISTVRPDEDVESVLGRMQREGATLYLVQDGIPLGLITQEDILEQVVGQMEDEYPDESAVSLTDALARGAIQLGLAANGRDPAIAELVGLIPPDSMPAGFDRSQILRLALQREEEISTDLGNGVAIPHARCAGLAMPIAVLGRNNDGVLFSRQPGELVRLIFLLVTPAERPEIQLALLSQVASLCQSATTRADLLAAPTAADAFAVVEASCVRSGTRALEADGRHHQSDSRLQGS